MLEASENWNLRKQLNTGNLLSSVQKIAQKQKITDTAGDDRDIIAMASEGEDAVVQVFFIRNGRLIGRDHFYLKIAENDTKSEILSSFIKQFYAGTPYIPAEIMLPEEIEDQEIIEEWLTTRKKEHKVHLRHSEERDKRKTGRAGSKRMPRWY